MTPLLHALNIGTLANWLSVAVFGTVAVVIPSLREIPVIPPAQETQLVPEDFTLGDAATEETEASGETTESAPAEIAEPLPAPPEMPEINDFSPLQEVPDLPAPAAKPSPQSIPAAPPATARKTETKPTRRATTTGKTSATGTPGGSGTGKVSSAQSAASRLAAGRMPPPSYPSAARRAGQTGTVVVEFTVDSSGRVISAYAKSASPWPLLNEEAVRTVRRWKFPAGGVMKLQRPIVFQLR